MFNDYKDRWENYEETKACYFLGAIFGGIKSLFGGGGSGGGTSSYSQSYGGGQDYSGGTTGNSQGGINLSGLGGILGPIAGGVGSLLASRTSANAQNNALNFQQGVYNNSQQQLAPYYTSGVNALNNLSGAVGSAGVPTAPWNLTAANFQSSPGYQFQLQQGLNAINNSGNPRTGALSGNTLQALQQYGTGLANQDWYNWLNNQSNFYNTAIGNLGGLASSGQNAATLTGPQANLVGGIANTTAGIGATNAAGTIGIANAAGNLGNSLTNNPYALAYAQGQGSGTY